MTEHPNLTAARAGYEAYAKGDMEALSATFADDIVWHSGGNNILSGTYEGKEAVFGFFARLMQETGGNFANEIHDMLANDDHGVVLVTGTATRGDRTLESRNVHVFNMEEGKLKEFWAFAEDQSVVDEFWS
jgi:ketosteroid isomerase-like protein